MDAETRMLQRLRDPEQDRAMNLRHPLAFTRHREAISGLRMQDRKRGTPQTARRRSALIAE